jgi:cell division transport system permease protein
VLRIGYFLRETGINLRRNLTLGIASLLTIAVSLSLFGMSLWLRSSVDNATQQWKGGVEFIVWMDWNPQATQGDIDAVRSALVNNPNIDADKLEFCDLNCAFEEARDLLSVDVIDTIEPGDMPTSFRVVPSNPDADVCAIGQSFDGQPGVDRISCASEQINDLQSLTGFLQRLALGGSVALLVASAMLIFNTIRTAIFSRRREIEVQKLVGATNWFIRVPFVLEGLVQGLVGGILAFGIVRITHTWFQEQIQRGQQLDFLEAFSTDASQMNSLGITLLVVGVVVGTVGSAIATSRFLDV